MNWTVAIYAVFTFGLLACFLFPFTSFILLLPRYFGWIDSEVYVWSSLAVAAYITIVVHTWGVIEFIKQKKDEKIREIELFEKEIEKKKNENA